MEKFIYGISWVFSLFRLVYDMYTHFLPSYFYLYAAMSTVVYCHRVCVCVCVARTV